MTELHLDVENIGGIDSQQVTFEGGTTLIAGPNASNKTSLLRAIAFGLGADTAPLKSGSERGAVRLRLGERSVKRCLERDNKGITTESADWVEGPGEATLVEQFAMLLAENPLRRAISRGEPVAELLKGPMDIDAMEAKRSRLVTEKRRKETELADLDDVDSRLEARQAERSEQRQHLTDLEAQLESLHEQHTEASGPDDQLQRLHERRADLLAEREQHSERIEELEDAIDRLDERIAVVESDLQDARETVSKGNIEQLKAQRAQISEQLSTVTERLDVLQSVLTANREMLDSQFTGALGRQHDLIGDEVTCWTCGNQTEAAAIEGTVERLGELIERDKERKAEREPEVSALTEQIETARESRHRIEELEAELSDLRDRRQARRESLDRKREALSTTRQLLAELDRNISAAETDTEAERSSLAEEIEATRVDIETTRRDIEQLEAACEELCKQAQRRDDLEASVTDLTDRIQTLTERIERIETHLREEFNAAMDDLLAELAFERIDRVWLDGEFKLVIAREVDGSVREDSLSHLAESEREMIGLVLGLAGFLAYDVGELTPVLLVDSLSAFDTVRADRLLSYFADKTALLLAAVHPTMAEELPFSTMSIGQYATP